MYRAIILLFIAVFLFSGSKAEEREEYYNEVANSIGTISTLKVFFEGSPVYFDYIRRNINFVDFINDPKAADVHVIVTRNSTGGGGTNYILNFYSQKLTQIGDISLNCISTLGDTDDEVRECITRTLKLGLMPYVNETTNGDMIDIKYTDNGKDEQKKEEILDPWKQWVFRFDANGGFNMEESKSNYNYSFNVRADRVTEKIKIRGSYWTRNRFEQIETDGEIITSENSNKFSQLQSVYSLTDRWSAGMFLSYFQSTYSNTQNSYDVKPAIEYNFFPWEDADKRVFTIAYFAGVEMKNYYETTIFGKDDEMLWAHNLKLNFEVIQPWGEIETRLEGSTYMHDLSKNHFTFSSDLSFRITRGLSLNFDFMASSIHDQLWKPMEDYSLEDILMGNVALPSTFKLSGGMGIRIQFGSLFNNVVNNRL